MIDVYIKQYSKKIFMCLKDLSVFQRYRWCDIFYNRVVSKEIIKFVLEWKC